MPLYIDHSASMFWTAHAARSAISRPWCGAMRV
jgi:hypothetical protein